MRIATLVFLASKTRSALSSPMPRPLVHASLRGPQAPGPRPGRLICSCESLASCELHKLNKGMEQTKDVRAVCHLLVACSLAHSPTRPKWVPRRQPITVVAQRLECCGLDADWDEALLQSIEWGCQLERGQRINLRATQFEDMGNRRNSSSENNLASYGYYEWSYLFIVVHVHSRITEGWSALYFYNEIN